MATAQSNLARKLTIIPAFQQPEKIRLRWQLIVKRLDKPMSHGWEQAI